MASWLGAVGYIVGFGMIAWGVWDGIQTYRHKQRDRYWYVND